MSIIAHRNLKNSFMMMLKNFIVIEKRLVCLDIVQNLPKVQNVFCQILQSISANLPRNVLNCVWKFTN